MKLFETKLIKRIAIWKSIGFIFWLAAFYIMPLFFPEASSMLSWAIFLWYITLWAIIWVFGVWNNIPIFKITVPYWLRWIWIWGWMNFILALFMFDNLTWLMAGTYMEWRSPFRIVLEWAVFWLIVDTITTKKVWEGKALMK